MLCTLRSLAQFVQGEVTDNATDEPLPGVYVYYMDDKSTMVHTDIHGKYKIAYRRGSLVFSMMGFDLKAMEVKEAGRLNVKLSETASSLTEVVVSKKKQKYSRKNNPAVEMMRKVIAAKTNSNLRRHDYLSYKKYEKMTMALNEFTEKVFEDDHFKRLPFLKEHVETHPTTGKLILPLTVEEKYIRTIYRKQPKEEKTIILAQREDGVASLINTGDVLTGAAEDCFTDVDLYNDNVRLLQYPFISPISTSNAINFYRYFIVDTLDVGRDRCFQVDFTPNNPRDFGFSGSLFIHADSTWRLKRVELNIPSKSNINFIDEMRIVQDYKPLPTGEQVVENNHTLIQMSLASWIQKFQVERVVKYSEWEFVPIPERTFKFRGDQYTDPSAMMHDDSYWNELRPTPLSKSENDMAKLIDRLYKLKGFKQIIWVAKALIENVIETSTNPEKPSKIDIGPVNTVIGSNFVEGLRLRMSANTTANLNPHWFFGGNVKYGFGDKRWKGKGEVIYSFNEKDYLHDEYPIRSLSLTYENDVCNTSDKFIPTDKDNLFVALKWTPVHHMNYYERYNLGLKLEYENGWEFHGRLRRESNEGAGKLFYQPMNGNVDPLADPSYNIHKIHFTELQAGFSYEPGAKYVNTKQRRLRLNKDAPIFSLTHTVGIKGFLGGEYNYNYTEATVYKRFRLQEWGKISGMLQGGVQWNKVPFPFLIMPAANLSYITDGYTFCLMRNMEFPTDRFVSLHANWDLYGKILNRIPLINKLGWREYVGVNCMWGMISDQNNPMLPQNYNDSRLFYMPGQFNGAGNFDYQTRVMKRNTPYVEVVVGLHNIFKILHIQYVRRLTYLEPGTQKWGIRGTFRVEF